MNKKHTFLIFFALLTCISFAQKKEKIKGNKNVIINEYLLEEFNRIVIGEKFNILLIEGTEPSIYIETDENLHEVINFSVSDSTLSFNTFKRITSKKKLEIKVTYTSFLRLIETLDNAEVSTSTSLYLDELVLKTTESSRAYLNVKSEKFKHISSGNAKVELNLNAKFATFELDKNSKLEALINADTLQVDMFDRAASSIEGNVEKLQIDIDNFSNFKGKNLTSKTCELKSRQNSNVYLQSLDNLKIDASGNSEVYIYGNPAITLDVFSDTSKLYKKELK